MKRPGGKQSTPAPDQAHGPETNPEPVPSPFLSLTLTVGPTCHPPPPARFLAWELARAVIFSSP
jgi:hypothetical protein